MATVSARIGKDHYRTEIASGSGNALVADEPVAQGGGNAGFTPSELMIASLAACTVITIRMFADRKEWPLEAAHVHIELERDAKENTTAIRREITLTGALEDGQKQRLLDVANKCPMHQVITHSVAITTTLKQS